MFLETINICCRDENWKVVRSVLQKFIPPPKIDGEADGGAESLAPAGAEAAPSPRSQRAADAAAALLNPADQTLHHMKPQDTFGMRSR